MNKYSNYLFFVLLCFFSSCQRDYITADNNALEELTHSASVSKTHFVSQDEATDALVCFLNTIDTEVRSPQSKRTIKEVYLRHQNSRSELDVVPEYAFNFNNDQGFAIVSADDRLPSVLCVTEKGNLRQGCDSLVTGAQALFDNIETYCRMVLGMAVSDQEGGTISGEVAQSLVPQNHLPFSRYRLSSSFGDILPCRWGQNTPFNDYCFADTLNTRSNAGCVPVAVGQSMWFWGNDFTYDGISYDWDVIHEIEEAFSENETDGAFSMVAHFIRMLGNPENLDANYYTRKGSVHIENVPRTFLNLGFSSGGSWVPYNFPSLFSSLDDGPALVHGYSVQDSLGYHSGHCWVVDQVRVYSPVRPNSLDPILVYSHCNWGWDGLHNGFFLETDFDALNPPTLPITRSDGNEPSSSHYYRYNILMNNTIAL